MAKIIITSTKPENCEWVSTSPDSRDNVFTPLEIEDVIKPYRVAFNSLPGLKSNLVVETSNTKTVIEYEFDTLLNATKAAEMLFSPTDAASAFSKFKHLMARRTSITGQSYTYVIIE